MSSNPVTNKKMFLSLTGLGLLGVLSLMLMPLPQNVDVPLSDTALKLIGMVQSAVFVMIAVGAGLFFTKRVGFKAPVIEAVFRGESVAQAIKPQIKPALFGGMVAGVIIVALAVLFKPYLPQAFVENGDQMASQMPVLVRFLYGGITEELLLRWFFMSLLVWIPFKLLQKAQGMPSKGAVWFGIITSAVLFGIGHLPAVYALVDKPVDLLIGYIILLNTVFGVVGGWLFWRKGLESAMLAHMMAHVVMLIAG